MRECTEMRVSGVVVDPNTKMPIVVLKDEDEKRLLPIWIGVMEAGAIAAALENVVPPRPMTHDLYANVLKELGVKVLRVEVTKIESNTFYAEITLSYATQILDIDARPSDAIALALRTKTPIHVADDVVKKAGIVVEGPQRGEGEQGDELKDLLANLPDEIFGKYKM
jgi:bifunctional DNase/RNase